jgi:uncharacterized damage-inducible protein DinB
MKKKLWIPLLALCMLSMANTLSAQSFTADSVKAQMLRDWQRAKSYTADYLKTMPADQYAKHPIDSIRSFAEQMLHLAAGTISLVSNGSGQPRIYNGYNLEKSATAQNKDSVSFYVNASYDYAIKSIESVDPATLGEIVKRGNFLVTKYGWLTKAFEHQTHHRGQCTIYIRLLGIKPPNEQLF